MYYSILCIPLSQPSYTQSVRLSLRRMYIVFRYTSPQAAVSYNDLVFLVHHLPPPLLIPGDFNLHHPLWGDSVTSPHAHSLSSLIPAFSLNCLNDGLLTHHCQTSSFSCIDVSLCPSFVHPLLSWCILSSFHSSDQYPTLLTEVFQNASAAHRSPRWCYERADWASFRDVTYASRSMNGFSSVNRAL